MLGRGILFLFQGLLQGITKEMQIVSANFNN